MASIGDTLRESRLRRGLTVEEAAESIRINARLLEAMEAEEWEKLPGRFFARAFLRQYASFVGVDTGLVSAELARWEEPVQAASAEPEPASERITMAPIAPDTKARREALQRWLGSLAVLVLAVAVCAALYAVWQQWHAMPAPAAEPAPLPSAPAVPPPQPAAQAHGPAPPPSTPAAPISLEIRATEEVWIRVSSDGTVAFSGTLQPGQSRAFQGRESMNVLAGNAGGLEAVFNGKPLGLLGPHGQVRVLELTPAEHRILERKPPPEP